MSPTYWSHSTTAASFNKEMATAAFNWFFSIQPDGLPERLIGTEPAFYLQWIIDHWPGAKAALAAEAISEYQRCFDAAEILTTNEEFRAAATIDLIHDEADKEHKVSCPVDWLGMPLWVIG
jgi:haloacetate dehalogenase